MELKPYAPSESERKLALQTFCQLMDLISNNERYDIKELSEYCYLIAPAGHVVQNEEIPLCVTSIIHGNEVVGLEVLIEFLEFLSQGVIHLKFQMAICLGNVEAYLKDKRFVKRDLNRCFTSCNKSQLSTELIQSPDFKRATKLQKIFKKCRYLVDLHQTQTPTLTPFLIFSHTPDSVRMAYELGRDLPIITYLGQTPDPQGMTATSYFKSMNKAGVTLEIGEKGLSPYFLAQGLRFLLKAVHLFEQKYHNGKLNIQENHHQFPKGIYTTSEAIFIEDPKGDLKSEISSFIKVKKGQSIGREYNQDVLAPSDGFLVFPKFRSGPYRVDADPNEPICKMIRPLTDQEYTLLYK